MQPFFDLTTTLLPVLYCILWANSLLIFRRDDPAAARRSRSLLAVVFGVHLMTVILAGVLLGRLPLATKMEFFSLLALAILGIYGLIELRTKACQTGFLAVGLAFLLQTIASAFGGRPAPDNPLLREPGYALHAVLILLAYTAMSLGFIYAVLYLIQARQLARHTFGLLFRRLPALEVLERMSIGAVKLALPLLLGALVSGHLWLHSLGGRAGGELAAGVSHLDPKILASWAIFLVYGAGLAGHRFLGWRGRRMNLVSITAFVCMILAMGMIHHFFESFHNFRAGAGS